MYRLGYIITKDHTSHCMGTVTHAIDSITSAIRGDYVIVDVCLSVRPSVCLFMNNVAQKRIDGFSSNFQTFSTYA